MKQSWNDYSKAAEKGPLSLFLKITIPILLLSIALGVIGYGLGWFSEAAKVAQEEFGPRAMLEKYEWFKDASAVLDKKQADISVYAGRITSLKLEYGSTERKDWAREDREQVLVWMSEVAGIKASFNQLAADYNAQMVKFNYRFANVGDLPRGATVPLPREYKPYLAE